MVEELGRFRVGAGRGGGGPRSGRLVPVTIDGTEAPLGFRQFQTIDLSQWRARGKAKLGLLLEAVGSLTPKDEGAPEPLTEPPRSKAAFKPPGRPWLLAAGPVALLLCVALGLWAWGDRDSLPVVEVAAADASPRSQAAANDLFVKLGTLAQVGDGKWQLIDSTSRSGNSDLVFRIANTGNDAKPQSNLVLLNGKNKALLWSGEFSFPAGNEADLRQSQSLTAGRVLGCALESRDRGGLSADLLKIFLDACASLADLSGEQYGPVTSQLRSVVDRAPRFEPAWSRLIMADSTALEYARFTAASRRWYSN